MNPESQQALEFIRYLLKQQNGTRPSTAKAASHFNVDPNVISNEITEINNDGIFSISPRNGGGLTIEHKIVSERDTYQHITKHLQKWINDNLYSSRETTPNKLIETYKSRLSGKWSTPDFTAVHVQKFLNLRNILIELTTIEVKHNEKSFNVLGVYEALAHTRASHYGILFFYDSITDTSPAIKTQPILAEIKAECVRLGIGLVISNYPCDEKTWVYAIPVREHTPDPRRVDDFIEEALNPADKNWLRTA